MLELRPEQAFLRKRQRTAVASLPGFVRGRHRLPSEVGRAGEQFVHELSAPILDAEVREVYESAKRILGLRRRQLSRAVADGGGNVDAPQFRFTIEVSLDRDDPQQVLWQRRVVLLLPPAALPADFDALFPVACDELVLPMAPRIHGGDREAELVEFDEVVERLEDFAARHGGRVEEDDGLGLAG
ncbi:MAG: hypothetical protein KC457_27270, partial [Myxococcales bacterium]|nr:hypothetical protein [Myxococcales bacterium]